MKNQTSNTYTLIHTHTLKVRFVCCCMYSLSVYIAIVIDVVIVAIWFICLIVVMHALNICQIVTDCDASFFI